MALYGAGLWCVLVIPAFAQSVVKPKMMVIFDTSGSMTLTPSTNLACQWTCGIPERGSCYDFGADGTGCPAGVPCIATGARDPFCAPVTFGDGSVAYPGIDIDGNGLFDDSRMYAAKEALKTALYGTAELEFGLMRYAQEEGPGIRASCQCSGCPAQCAARHYSPYDAEGVPGGGAINYDGLNIACRDGGQVLVPIGPQTGNDIEQWMDHTEAAPYDPNGDRELRADGATPIAGSLQSALSHFRDVVIPNDDRRECRNYFVLLLTDGEETCALNQLGLPDLDALRDSARALLDLRSNSPSTST